MQSTRTFKRKSFIRTSIEGYITIEDENRDEKSILAEIKHNIWCTLEDGCHYPYFQIGSNDKIKMEEDDD